AGSGVRGPVRCWAGRAGSSEGAGVVERRRLRQLHAGRRADRAGTCDVRRGGLRPPAGAQAALRPGQRPTPQSEHPSADVTERSMTMRVFVVGASGAIGTRLVPQLIDRGHEVIGTFSSPGNGDRVRALGAEPIVLDLLDLTAVRTAVLETKPDAIVHQATALANARFGRNFDRTFAQTNRLRTEGTDNLLAAAREADVSRFVAQSFARM